MISVPPRRDVASPSEDTTTSMVLPARAKGGNAAVTITAAVLVVRIWSSVRLPMPRRSSIPSMALSVKGALRSESPVPFSPTTRP